MTGPLDAEKDGDLPVAPRSCAAARPLNGSNISFETPPVAPVVTPGMARVLLRILRKAAEKHGVDPADVAEREPLAS
jgi:hypothetical protein